MAIIVIGAQASGLGKTGLICSLIAAMPERRWTAIKITQCSHAGAVGAVAAQRSAAQPCDCRLDGRTFAISEEHELSAGTDSSRYLAAGAVRSLWVRTLPGHLADAMPRIREEIAAARNVILESNSVLGFLEPDLYALIVSPCVADFKHSARRWLSRASAILMAAPPPDQRTVHPAWLDELGPLLKGVPQFAIAQPQLVSPELLAFIGERIGEKVPSPEPHN